jgi:uncharacterized repeat protein (TIGR03803 family)
MLSTRRVICALVAVLAMASLPVFAGRRSGAQSSENGGFRNCGTGNTCPFIGSRGTAILAGTDKSGNAVTVTVDLYDWGVYPCGDNTKCKPVVNAAVLDVTLTGTSPIDVQSVVVKGKLANPNYVSCGPFGIGCIYFPVPDDTDVQEPTPIAAADQGTALNTRWDFGGTPSQNPPPPAIPFNQLLCNSSDEGGFDAICTKAVLGEAVLTVTGSVSQNKLGTSPSNYLVTLTDGTTLGALVIPQSPSQQAQNNTEATATVITGTSHKEYIDTSQAYPGINQDGSMNYPPGFALAPVPPTSPSNFPSCYPAGESRVFRSVWYTYTAPAEGNITIDTTGSRYDTLVYVFVKGNPTAVAGCDDDLPTGLLQAATTFKATKDITYEIVVYESPTYTSYAYPLSVDGALYFSLKLTTGSSTTTTKLKSSPNPTLFGQTAKFIATVTPKLAGTPTGTVTFSEGQTILGTATILGNQATLPVGVLPVGKNLITATYTGDSNYLGSAGSTSHVVNQASTTVNLSSGQNPSGLGQPVTFTANIQPQYGGQASGGVNFYDSGTLLGAASVGNNSANFTTSSLSLGTHSITAMYSGDSNLSGSTSKSLSQVVKNASTTSLTSSQNPSQKGSTVSLTVTVTSSVETPTGTVQIFNDNRQLFATLTLSSGTAQYSTSLLPPGTDVITAVYSGDSVVAGSTSAPLDQVVQFPANFHVLYNFTGAADGALPSGGVSLDSSGNLYGVTQYGGDLSCPQVYGNVGCGTVFKLDVNNSLTVLHAFGSGSDGVVPYARPILDTQNNLLFGTTSAGGSGKYWGTVFKVDPLGNESVLYSFTGPGGDGWGPRDGLVQDSKSNLYGSTPNGGTSGDGTVFKVTLTGEETVLYSFTGGVDGAGPSGLTRPDSNGRVYGTTPYGGSNGSGDVFEVDSTGHQSVVYSFGGTASDGFFPKSALVRDSSGNLYGTTANGGAYGYGTIFEVSSSGQESVLYSFAGSAAGDGRNPSARLVRDSQGNLYGATYAGGLDDQGTVFKLIPGGQETVLYSFYSGGIDGTSPSGALIVDTLGNLYGVTNGGGVYGYGMVFKITPQ